MSGFGSDLGATFQELQRRRVFRVGATYAVVAFVVLQLAEIVFPAFGLGDTAMQVLVIAALLGFVLAVALSWAYDITRSELIRDEHTDAAPRWMQFAIIALMIGVVGLGAWATWTSIGDEPTATAAPDDKSIAVLPFADLSPQGDQEYFGDGIAEELLNVLTKIEGLRVAARTSSFAYKGQSQNVQAIGRELGVASVLEGSIRKAGDSVRITAQLIDTRTGFHLWSETYDRELNDIFAIQDEITAAIVDALKVQLLGDARAAMRARETASFDAYDLYLAGRHSWHERTAESIAEAVDYFQRAIEIDPEFVRAWTGLADSYVLMVNYGNARAADAHPKAEEALAKAMELDDSISEVWASKGLYLSEIGENEEAEAAFERALELDDENAMAWLWYANLLDSDEEKLDAWKRAYSLEPMSKPINTNLAFNLFNRGAYAESRPYFQRLKKLSPEHPSWYDFMIARTYYEAGELALAVQRLRSVAAADPWNEDNMSTLALAYLDLGMLDEARRWADIADAMDPLDNDVLNAKAMIMVMRNEYSSLIPYFEDKLTLIRRRDDITVLAWLTLVAEHVGDRPAGQAYLKELMDLLGGDATNLQNRGLATVIAWAAEQLGGPHAGGDTILRETAEVVRDRVLEFREDGHSNPDTLLTLAGAYAALDDPDAAIEALSAAVDAGLRSRVKLQMQPTLEAVEADPRYQAILSRIDRAVEDERRALDGLVLASFTPPEPRSPRVVGRSTLERYVGTYANYGNNTPWRFELDDGGFYLSIGGAPRRELRAISEDTFYAPISPNDTIQFQFDDGAERATHFLWTAAGQVQRFKHLADFRRPETVEVPVEVLARYTGSWAFPDIDQTFGIELKEDRLWLLPGGGRARLYPVSETEFFLDVATARLRFSAPQEHGEVREAWIILEGREVRGTRVE